LFIAKDWVIVLTARDILDAKSFRENVCITELDTERTLFMKLLIANN